jgi:hypothetical protein
VKKRSKKRKGHKRPSLASLSKSITLAAKSAARKGKDWKTDKRIQVLLKAERQERQRVHDLFAERG